MQINHKFHCAYSLSYHFVFVTKYRKAVLDAVALRLMSTVIEELAERWEGELLEFNGESDHVHVLISLPPKAAPSVVANNLKTVTSRLLRKQCSSIRNAYRDPVLWSRSYFVTTCGGAPLEVIKRYIQQQNSPA